jgi:tRNA A37 N6-isopentenylltransferase MiaA
MNKIKPLITAFAVLLVGGSTLLPSAVYAQSSQQGSITDQIRTTARERINEQKEAAQKKRAEIQAQAEAKLKEAQANKELRTAEVRQKACESRKSALNNKIKATSAAADRHLTTIDKFNERLEAFVEKYSLEVTAYSEKQATVVSARDVAVGAVDTLKLFSNNEIDCAEIDSAATSAMAYKEALMEAREAILAYRMATKDLLVAIKTSAEAKESETTESEDANQEESSQESTQENTEEASNQEPTN